MSSHSNSILDNQRENDSQTTQPQTPPLPETDELPPQLHAGRLDGPGPEYGKEHGIGAKIQGMKEQIKGTITMNPELKQRGKERQTGELAEKEKAEQDAHNPFQSASTNE